jgi:hypothetical protein
MLLANLVIATPQTADEILIDLLPARYSKTPNAPVRTPVVFAGVEIGCWRDPECSAARGLVDNGKASRADRLVTVRDGVRCMTGPVGWFADRVVEETDKVGPRFKQWRPFLIAEKAPAACAVAVQNPQVGSSTHMQASEAAE